MEELSEAKLRCLRKSIVGQIACETSAMLQSLGLILMHTHPCYNSSGLAAAQQRFLSLQSHHESLPGGGQDVGQVRDGARRQQHDV